MAGAPSRQPLPPRVRAGVAAVAAAAVLCLPLSALVPGSIDGGAAIFAAVTLAALLAGAHHFPIHVGPKRKLDTGTAAEVAAVLLLPGPLAVLTIVVGAAVGDAGRRAPAEQRAFNLSAAALRAVIGGTTYAGITHLGPGGVLDLVASLAAPAAMFGITTALVGGIAALQAGGSPLRRTRLPAREVLVADALLSLTGIVGAGAAASRPWTLPLLAAPAMLAHRAARDSTALREQTRIAEEALAEAREALAARDHFLSLAAHELRTPLTSLRVYLSLAGRRLRGAPATAEARSFLDHADAQVERMRARINDLLDVSHWDGGRFHVQPEPVAIGPIVRRAVEAQRATADPPREIALDMPEPSPVIRADSDRIEQVLTILLDNACKYSPTRTPIRTRVRVEPEVVTIAVQDQGVGIPPQEQARIFERFHRAGNIDKGIAGLGLGLYIAQEIIAAHGGNLTVSSQQGAGSTFEVVLPRASQAQMATAVHPPRPPARRN